MRRYHPWGKYSVASALVWLTKRGVLRAFLVLVVVFFVPTALLALAQGTALPDKTPFITFFEDFSTVVDFLLLCPLALVLAARYYIQSSDAVAALDASEVLVMPRHEVDSLVARFNNLLGSPAFSVVPVLVGFTAMLSNAAVRSAYTHDYALNGVHSITGWYVVVVTALFMAAMFELVIRAVCSNVLISRLVAVGVRPNPIASDRCGGFSPIGRAALLLSYAVLVEFLTVSVMLAMDALYFGRYSSFRVVGLGAAVLIFSPLLFLWLVLPVHRAMRRAKEAMLHRIDTRSRTLGGDLASYLFIEEDTQGPSAAALIESYEGLRRLHAMADEAPSWPVTRVTTASYAATLAVSLLISLTSNALASTVGTVAKQLLSHTP